MSRQGLTFARVRWSAGALRRGFGVAIGRAARTALPFGRLKLKSFLFAPPDLRTSDPTIAADIYSGQFVFAGRLVDAGGRSPFDVTPPSLGWADTLNSFGWLRHLQAANTPLARENGRTLIRDFIARPVSPLALRPFVVCRRLMALLSQSPLVLDGADHVFYAQYLDLVSADVRRLRDAVDRTDDPLVRLNAAVALTALGLCTEGAERILPRAGKQLGERLDEQILSDGGHVSRNPRVLIDLLLDLLPLRSTYAARGLEAPSGLVSAIDRIVPHLKMLRHPDGSIALFNGMGVSQVDALATIFASHDSGGRAATEAPYSGYQRVEAGQSVLIAETGPSPPFAASAEAMAGCLSFEFSHGRQRIFVNCGMPRLTGRDIPVGLKSTAAHSATSFGDTSSCRFLTREGETRIVSGPGVVTVQRSVNSHGESLALVHDGYRSQFGVGLTRRLLLGPHGTSLSGSEAIEGTPNEAAVTSKLMTRFHLHPSMQATLLTQSTLLLTSVRGPSWRFGCEGAGMQIEESVFFAAIDGTRRTAQIVLTAEDVNTPVLWTLRKEASTTD
ncbi:MAG: heparinase II/III family protein [Bosea sp. (in: a-proteobacteria)]